MTLLHRFFAFASGMLVAASAFASSVVIPVPEPGVIELVGAGAVAGLIVWVRNRRK